MNGSVPLLRTPEHRLAAAIFLLLALLYVPFAGNYGLWDPWETHYSEVARQMLARGDFVSQWWPGSPQDRNEFWSKPVLTFWLMAIGMAIRGVGFHPPSIPTDIAFAQYDGEMATSWAVEWAVRIPFVLSAIVCVWAVWELVRRLAGRRAALWAAIVLGTSSQFFYIARQAMTDMAFVMPMAVALSLAGLALLLPKEEVEAPLPRRGRGLLSWPHAPSFYALMALVLLTIVPQLLVISLQVKLALVLGNKQVRTAGIVPMLPYIAALLVFLWLGSRARCRRQIYLHHAFLMCGLATLAKGPAGVAMPVLAILVYLVMQGEWRRLLPPPPEEGSTKWVDRQRGSWGFAVRLVARNPFEILAGLLVFIAVTFPWYHAMLIRHGMGFWNEFIGDNYVHRAAGRHGDRGTFEYYLQQIGIGMFPWSAVIAASVLSALARLRDGSTRTKLRVFALAWFLVMFGVVSLVNTKFHHYILPGLPALAILAGLYLDELFERPSVRDALVLLVVGLPLLAFAARDIAMYPARLTWLFDYDYVNAPNGGRPWPNPAEWGDVYSYGGRIAAGAIAILAANALLGVITIRRARRGTRTAGGNEDVTPSGSIGNWLALAGTPVATLLVAQLVIQPPFGDGTPHPSDSGWILVAAMSSIFLVLLVAGGLRSKATRAATIGLAAVGVAGCVWTAWGLDRLLTDLSPHWSQKHVIAAYYKLRKGPEEPLIAWQMYWRGETFYTKNAIYDHRINQADKTVFLGDRNAEKMQTWFRTHGGRRVFFVVERARFEFLRSLLPQSARASLRPVDLTNNKLYLAEAVLPASAESAAPAWSTPR